MNNLHATLLSAVLTDDSTLFYSILSGNYNLHFTAKLVQSDVKGCQDIELNWNTLPISNIHYTIDVFIEEEGVIWNRTTDGGHVLLSHQDLRAGVKYGLELEVIVDINKDTSLSLGDIPSQLLNITTPSCSKPNGEHVWSGITLSYTNQMSAYCFNVEN